MKTLSFAGATVKDLFVLGGVIVLITIEFKMRFNDVRNIPKYHCRALLAIEDQRPVQKQYIRILDPGMNDIRQRDRITNLGTSVATTVTHVFQMKSHLEILATVNQDGEES